MPKFFAIFLSLFSFAAANSAKASCEFKTPSDLVKCAENKSPAVLSAQLEVDRAKAAVQAAGQWRNPELSAETFQGDINGEKRSETDISLGIPIEFGGKISARKAVTESGVMISEAKLFEAKAQVRAQVLLKLHRLRQVLHEQEIADEAIKTYSKLLGQYSKRPSLSPEQQISSSVFQLSQSEYEMKKASLSEELESLNFFFRLNLELTTEDIKLALPESPRKWPELGNTKRDGLSARQRVLQAEVNSAQAELAVAKSESWPTLVVGPSLKMLTEDGQTNNLVGMNVSLALPLFNTNGGARAAATSSLRLTEAQKQNGARHQELKLEELSRVYNQTVQVLSKSLSHENIEKRHANAERLFSKGVVPSSLVIEAHRTSFELERVRHERELKALETLFEIYALEGNLLGVSL